MPLPALGFPAQPRSALLERLIGDLRRRSDTVREEAVTGLRADPARALNGKVAELLGIDRALAETGQYREIIGLAQARATAIQGSLDSLRELAVSLHVDGQTAIDSGLSVAGEAVSASARQALDAAVAALNTRFGGRGLFAGDDGDAPAVAGASTVFSQSVAVIAAAPSAGAAYADLTVAFTATGGLFETTLYTGGAGPAPDSEIAPGERLGFAQRADAPPLRALLRDLAALAAAYDPATAIPDDERRGLAERAVAGLRNNVGDLAGLAALVGTAEERMATVDTRHQAAETSLTQARMRLAGRDQYQAAAELTQLESQLETTYLATARLANLSLANFLR